MFGLSLVEVGFILVLALVVLGPEKIPPLARQIGRLMRQVRQMTGDLRQAVEIEGLRDDLDRSLRLPGKRPRDPYGEVRAQEEAWRSQSEWRPKTSPPAQAAAGASLPSISEPSLATPATLAAGREPVGLAPEIPSAEALYLPPMSGEPAHLLAAAARTPQAWEDEALRVQTLVVRCGLGSMDVKLASVALPRPPVELLAALRAVAVVGGVRELQAQRAALQESGARVRPMAPGVRAASVRLARLRRAGLRACPLGRRGGGPGLRSVTLAVAGVSQGGHELGAAGVVPEAARDVLVVAPMATLEEGWGHPDPRSAAQPLTPQVS